MEKQVIAENKVVDVRKQEIIKKTAAYARETLEGEGSGHDWWHVYRVWKLAKHIAEYENADSFVVELAALLQSGDETELLEIFEHAKQARDRYVDGIAQS